MKLIRTILIFIFSFSLVNICLSAEKISLAPQPPIENKRLALEIFKQLVEIRSIHEEGTKKIADVLAAQFIANGFSPSDVILIPEKNFPSQVNLIVRLKGKGNNKPILWTSHLDVVEAKAEDWSVAPFKFIEKEGYFYGRGTSDMKDEAAAVAAALIRLKKEGFVPDRDIIATFTTDEEVGGEQNGLAYLLNHHRNLIDAEFAINPDGGTGEFAKNKRLNFGVKTSEKIYATFLLEVTNKGGHSSEPRADNAIYTLADGLKKFSQYQFPFVINKTIQLYFQRMATMQTGETRADMLAVSQDKPDLLAAKRLSKNDAFNAALHTTCVATMISGGVQENALPQRVTAKIQCRIVPSESIEQTQKTIQTVLDNPEIKVSISKEGERAPESPPTAEFLTSIEKVTHSMWPGVIILPGMETATTDSRYTRGAGIPSYGVGGNWYDLDDIRWHGKDERHEVNDFYSSVEFTYRLMKELGNSQIKISQK